VLTANPSWNDFNLHKEEAFDTAVNVVIFKCLLYNRGGAPVGVLCSWSPDQREALEKYLLPQKSADLPRIWSSPNSRTYSGLPVKKGRDTSDSPSSSNTATHLSQSDPSLS